MNFTERISTIIHELKEQGHRKYEVADTAGYSRSIVTQWENGTTVSISPEGAMKLEEKFGYNHRWLLFGELPKMVENKHTREEIIPDDRWQPIKFVGFKLKAGVSGFAIDYLDEEEYEPLFYKKSWFTRRGYDPNKLFALFVRGESMSPTLEDGAVVVVNTENSQPKDNTIFAVNYHGETVVKRLLYDMGKYWLASDNPDKGLYPRVLCDENTTIIGKVVHYQGEF